MTPEFFVDALKVECRDSAVRDCIEQFRKPSGRRPKPELVQISEWFNALTEADQRRVAAAMREAAEATLFGVLCVVDGVRAIEAADEKSEFCLTVKRSNGVTTLVPSDVHLHDILRAQ
ncbi:hypothetical protein D3C87_1896450 [compost metagenome]